MKNNIKKFDEFLNESWTDNLLKKVEKDSEKISELEQRVTELSMTLSLFTMEGFEDQTVDDFDDVEEYVNYLENIIENLESNIKDLQANINNIKKL